MGDPDSFEAVIAEEMETMRESFEQKLSSELLADCRLVLTRSTDDYSFFWKDGISNSEGEIRPEQKRFRLHF